MSIVVYAPGEAIPYTAKDLDDLCLPVTGITPSDFLEDDWLDSRYGLFYVEKDVPIGVAFCSVKDHTETEAAGEKVQYQYMSVHVLCVSAAARRGGIGGKLLKEVETLAKKLKLTIVRLSAIANQVHFYTTNGFVNKGSEDEEDEYYLMEKILKGGRRRAKTSRIRRSRQTTRRVKPRVALR